MPFGPPGGHCCPAPCLDLGEWSAPTGLFSVFGSTAETETESRFLCQSFGNVLIFLLLKIDHQGHFSRSPQAFVPWPSGEGTISGPLEAVKSFTLRGDSAAGY